MCSSPPSNSHPNDVPASWPRPAAGMPSCGPRSIDCWPQTPTPTASSNPHHPPRRTPPMHSSAGSETARSPGERPPPPRSTRTRRTDGDGDRRVTARTGATETSAQRRSRCHHGTWERATPAADGKCVPTGEGIGTVIAGRYTLVEEIGEGGMGAVWLAEQTEPVKRQVALKLIKTGMDSRGRAGPVRRRAAGAGADGPPQHRPRLRRRRHRRPASRSSSWSWSRACRSPSTATRQRLTCRPGWNCSCRSARRCSTPTRRGSSTATSSRATCWSRRSTAGRCRR